MSLWLDGDGDDIDLTCCFSLFLLQTGAVHEEFYKDCDLTVGGEVNVWGRRLIITDCDAFTKEYYHSRYGTGNPSPDH